MLNRTLSLATRQQQMEIEHIVNQGYALANLPLAILQTILILVIVLVVVHACISNGLLIIDYVLLVCNSCSTLESCKSFMYIWINFTCHTLLEYINISSGN